MHPARYGGVGLLGLFCCHARGAFPLVTRWKICSVVVTISPLIGGGRAPRADEHGAERDVLPFYSNRPLSTVLPSAGDSGSHCFELSR